MHANEVVSVHDRMDESVEEDGQVDVSIIQDIHVEPIKKKDGSVVVHVQERELTPLLSQNYEDCVPKVPYLRDVEKPQEIAEGRILDVECIARHRGVTIAVGQEPRFDGHVCAKEDLGYVVNEFDGIRVNGREGFHDLRAYDDERHICYRDGNCGAKVAEPPTLSVSAEAAGGIGPVDDGIADFIHEAVVCVHLRCYCFVQLL
mmetsp:Transcript_31212/g.75472  ORF Transcript_31212/g.75472 Transcript_31212/m.75472 type:complete len:203 (-) Transcript_31212:129-737(-)